MTYQVYRERMGRFGGPEPVGNPTKNIEQALATVKRLFKQGEASVTINHEERFERYL